MNQGPRPRPAMMGAPPVANNIPPMGGPPSMGPPGGATRPMIGMPRPMGPGGAQVRPPQSNTQMMAAGSGGSGTEQQVQEVLNALGNLFNVYSQVEPNAKVKQQTEIVYNLLRDRLQEGTLSPNVLSMLLPMLVAADQNNLQVAQNIHKDMIQKCWNEVKDWINGLKVLITFKQRFQQ